MRQQKDATEPCVGWFTLQCAGVGAAAFTIKHECVVGKLIDVCSMCLTNDFKHLGL